MYKEVNLNISIPNFLIFLIHTKKKKNQDDKIAMIQHEI